MFKDKINISELLKDCPAGMELDCSMFENTYFDKVCDDEDCLYQIICYVIDDGVKNTIKFTKYGRFNTMAGAKCVTFPKGKTTWEGFQRPFKDGDILTNERGSIFIYKGPMYYNKLLLDFYCGYRVSDGAFVPKLFKDKHFGDISECRFATEKEKQKLFDAIKAKGYRWNAETKTLEMLEPRFKVGDRIKSKISQEKYTVTDIRENVYFIISDNDKYGYHVSFDSEINYELLPNKFDITTLKPFDKVLVRYDNSQRWVISFFSHYNGVEKHKYYCINGCRYAQCIPYGNNEHLLDTADNCNDFYKTWK